MPEKDNEGESQVVFDEQALAFTKSEALHGAHAAILLGDQIADLGGRLPRVWYPAFALEPPHLSVTLHTDSLGSATDDDTRAIGWLIDTAQHKDIDLVAMQPRLVSPPSWIGQISTLAMGKAGPGIRQLHADSMRPDWDEVRPEGKSRAAYVDLFVHLANHRHILVSLDDKLLDDALQPTWNRETVVFRPTEAMRYVDLYLKAFGRYRVQPLFMPNRGLYYWMRLWNLVPAFQSAWPYAVFGCEDLPNGSAIHDFMHALYARLIGQMQATDRIGWLRYSPPNNDTRDEMLNLMNYFVILSTGIFDSLAWLASHRYDISMAREHIALHSKRQPGTPGPFFTALATQAPTLVTYLLGTDVQARIALFYGPRHAIQHRLILTGGHLFTGQPVSDCNVVFLSNDDARPIQAVDYDEPANAPFSGWGIMTFADSGRTILEPYRFARTALKFLVMLVNECLNQLDLSGWISQKPEVKAIADEVIAEGRQQNCVDFAVPFP